MTSTQQNKKGVVLVELIASIMMMGLISTMLMSITLFVFKSLEITSNTTKQNNIAMSIAQSVSNYISGWNPTDIDVSTSNNDINKIVFTRSEFFYENSDGVTIRIQLSDTEVDKLVLELITTGSDSGKIKFSYTPHHSKHPDYQQDREYTYYIDTDFSTLNLDETTITYSALTKEVGGGVTEVKSYLVKMNIVTESPSKIVVPISIPVIVKK